MNFEGKFCPLLTKDIKHPIECSDNCMWYVCTENKFPTCAVALITMSHSEILTELEKQHS